MTNNYRHGADCFEIISFIGGSSNGKIYNVRHNDTGEPLTMHVIPKTREEQKQCNSSLVVEGFKIPFTVNLRYTFETKSRSYLILDTLKEERKLSRFYQTHGTFNANEVMFIVSEIVLAISQLHAYCATYGLIDLDHIYLDITGHVRLKRELLEAHYWLRNECLRCRQLGTCLYHKEASVEQEAIAKDWADLGRLLCVLLGSTVEKEAIRVETRLVQHFLPEDAANLLNVLLNWKTSPFTASQIQEHVFFCHVNWQKAQKRQLTPPDIFIRTPIQSASKLKNTHDLYDLHDTPSHEQPLNHQGLSESSNSWKRTEIFNNHNHDPSITNHLAIGNHRSINHRSHADVEFNGNGYLKGNINDHSVLHTEKEFAIKNEDKCNNVLRKNDGSKLEKFDHQSHNDFTSLRNNHSLGTTNRSFDSNISTNDFERQSFDKCDEINKPYNDYCPDDVKFVTVESLEKSFREKLMQTKKTDSNEAQQNSRADMSYKDFSSLEFKDLSDASKDYPRYSAGILTEQRQQPALASLYTALANDYPVRYIMGYESAASEDDFKGKFKQYGNFKQGDRAVYPTNRTFENMGNLPSPLNEKPYPDVNANILPTSKYEEASLPVFTRSNSYHGSFAGSSLGQRAHVNEGPKLIEKAQDLVASNPDKWKANFNDDSSICKHSYVSKQLAENSFNVNFTQRSGINENCDSGLSSFDKRSQSLINVNLQNRGFQTENHPVFKSGFGGDAAHFANAKASSPCATDDDDQFVKEYLNKSFPLDSRVDAENDVLKKTWPVGYNLSRPSSSRAEPERKHFSSLVQRISDHNALQRIRQGAYLQGRRDFQVPLKRNLTATKSMPYDTISNPVERNNVMKFSRSFDDESPTSNEEKPSWGVDDIPKPLHEYRSASTINSNADYQGVNTGLDTYVPRKAWTYERSENYGERGGFSDAKDSHYQSAFSSYPMLSNRSLQSGFGHLRPSYSGRMGDGLVSGNNATLLNTSQSDEQDGAIYIFNHGNQEYKGKSDTDNINVKLSNETRELSKEEGTTSESVQVAAVEDVIESAVIEDDVFAENEELSGSLINEKPGKEEAKQAPANQSKGADDDKRSSKKKPLDSEKVRRSERSRKRNVEKQKLRKCQSTGNVNEGTVENNKNGNKLSDEGTKNHKKTRKRANLKKSKSADNGLQGNICEAKNKEIKQRSNRERDDSENKKDINGQRLDDQHKESKKSNSENKETGKINENDGNKSGKKSTRSVSFHETTKNPDGPGKSPITRKTQSAGAVDSQRLKLSLGRSMRDKDLNIEILPNPKTHRGSHRRLRSVEDERTLKSGEDQHNNTRKASLDSNISKYNSEAVDATDLVDRLRVISEGARSARSSPNVDRRSTRNGDRRQRLSPDKEIDRSNSVRNIIKPKITVQNSTPRSMSPVFDDKDGCESQKENSRGFVISRESSIGSASDLWLDEDEVKSFGRKGILCKRSASTASSRSVESVEYFRARYSKSPTLTSNSSEEDVNNRDTDKQSYNSGKSIDSGLSDIFETSKEEDLSSPATRGRSNAISKSDSGVVKDINQNRNSQSDDVFLDEDQINKESESLCPYCNHGFSESGTVSEDELSEMCKKCHKKKIERKEAVVELIQTEINYGQDLRILKEEFYAPIKNGGILSTDNVNAVFLNLQELIDVNSKLCITLQDDLEECITREDQELESLQVGRVFLENVEFFQAYEVFCSKQRQAAELVESLQKKSELLRIFLQVSCKENSKLRKMDLKSFLTMPVQRIMKYPLLLTRIYRATPRGNSDREALIHARRKIEEQITKINEIASGRPAKLRKSKSTSALNQTESRGNHLTRLVAEILDWKLEETQIVLSDAFEISCCELINATNWSRKSMKKSCKVQTILCLYGVLEQLHMDTTGGQCGSGNRCEATNAAVIILKKKSAHRYSLFKEPIMLSQAVISEREDVKIAFEISPIAKEPLTFVADDPMCSQKWLRSLRYYARDLGIWRARRNAMANIMIQSMS